MPSTDRRPDSPDTSLLGRQIDEQFWELMDRDYWTEHDIFYLSTKVVTSEDKRREIFRKLTQVRKGEYVNNGQADTEMDAGANLLFMRDAKEIFQNEYATMIHGKEMDPLTRAAILSTSRESSYMPFKALSEEVWISWLEPGTDGYVIGSKGSGKTSIGSLVGRIAIHHGRKVLGAIPLSHPVDGYIFATSGTQMLRTFCLLRREGVDILVLLDEGFFSYSGETPLKTEVMRFRQFTRLFRKLGASLLDITQYIEDVPGELRRTAVFRVRKVSKRDLDRAHIQIKGKLGGKDFDWSGRVKWIPDGEPHCLPYVSEHPAAFIMDFDPLGLMEYLSTLPMEANPFEEALHWLDERGLHFKLSHKRWFARRAVEVGISQTKIAQVLGVTQQTISRWVSKDEAESILDDEFLGGDESA